MTALLAALACSSPTPPPRVYAKLPEFRLTDQTGAPFGSRELRGKTWLADFMFTRCPTACPRLTALMKRVRESAPDVGARLHLVSFTIDPAHDTPPVLLAYARRNRATTRWSFLTGSLDDLERTIVRGFKVTSGREEEDAEARGAPIPQAHVAEVFHGTHLVLVDGAARVRGYYGAEDDDVVERIVRDAGSVLAE